MTLTDKGIDAMSLVSAAIEKGLDAESLRAISDMAERETLRRAKAAYAKAKGEALPELGATVAKTKQVHAGAIKYRHAELSSLVEGTSSVLAKHGLSFNWHIDQADGHVHVSCVLSHIDGHSESVSISAPADSGQGRNAVQAIGSTITYLQRYTLKSILGMAEQDNDGRAPAPATDSQMRKLEQLRADKRLTEKQREWLAKQMAGGIDANKASRVIRAIVDGMGAGRESK